ncbi:E3 ubiquitin/ISG15 ligase TRIM25 isoform X2 [Chanos chanos]|uniref:RING-type E3 ubiquitin transferase n=1 Tax=Chanos chanos TaxID=29144 RepID=A0A6J2W249_CHACN|nr:E3 ubiquitin/ISG15 ligase TRIM25-like isoform X2 [Chanos chanos]
MAADIQDQLSLLGLEEELTCSICLCPFDSPVTLPCGHNFCQNCLDETWKTSYVCPQCRTHFNTKPELKKNTVLATVVEAFRMRSGGEIAEDIQIKKDEPPAVMCDACLEVKAVKTCLTCMASYCEEHIKPHQENPVFRAHLLNDPLSDLSHRICSEHCKLMELYCADHERCICSSCLQIHKGCSFCTLDEQRTKKENEFQEKLTMLDGKIDKNQTVITQMREQQSKLKDSAANRKRALQAEYKQLRDLIDKDEQEALMAVDRELETGQSKLAILMKKFDQNVQKMLRAKDSISNTLGQSQSLSFLQASVDLPSEVKFEPYSPRINLDSKTVIGYHSSIAAMKELVGKILTEQVENRISLLKPGILGQPVSPTLPNPFETDTPSARLRDPSPGAGLKSGGLGAKKKSQPNKKPDNKEQKEQKEHKGPKEQKERRERKDHKSDKHPKKQPPPNRGPASPFSKSTDNLYKAFGGTGHDNFQASYFQAGPVLQPLMQPVVQTMSPSVKRSDLLQYGTILMFDEKTAHKRIALSENFTKASVSEEPSPYSDNPARFSVCSQVLCSKGFSRGRHYWEVKMSSNNFCGLGIAYGSIDRKGPSSRLGRNAQSWCVEWFNVKLSAWHANSETVLTNPNPKRVGVLLDCDGGSATLYTVADRAYPFHTFVFPFTEPVYPAFWIFSSGSSIAMCKLTS